MATRIITHTQKNRDGDIRQICNPTAPWSPCNIEQAIIDIESQNHSYVALASNGSRTPIHVVNHPRGKYLRTNHDVSDNNNLDSLPPIVNKYPLPNYIGNYPKDRESDWTDDLQGVTHSSDHWFFTQLTKLFKFHVSTRLNDNMSSAVVIRRMPTELKQLGGDHFGDPDYRVVNEQGYIFIPVEGIESDAVCNKEPRLAVFRDDDQLSYVGSCVLPQQKAEFGTGRAGWCAFSPIDNLLYSSTNQITATKPVYRYQFDFAALERGEVALQSAPALQLLGQNGTPININKYIQGGCFSPNGILFICNGKEGGNERHGGIRAFLPSGEFLYKSSTNNSSFLYQYDSDLSVRQEPEGITFWDLDLLPDGLEAPHITGQLHAILLDNESWSNDAIYFKHYNVHFN